MRLGRDIKRFDVDGSVVGSGSGTETGFGLAGLPLFFGGSCISVYWAFLLKDVATEAWTCEPGIYVTGAWYSRAFLALAGRAGGTFVRCKQLSLRSVSDFGFILVLAATPKMCLQIWSRK